MRRDQNEKSRTTSDPARTSSSRRARRVASMSRWTSSGSGIVVMPRDQASWSKERRVIPCRSYCRATVDLPAPAGPHMKITRAMIDTLCASGGGCPERGGGRRGRGRRGGRSEYSGEGERYRDRRGCHHGDADRRGGPFRDGAREGRADSLHREHGGRVQAECVPLE